MTTHQAPILSKLKDSWPSVIVARESIREFSGGALHPRTLANLDSKKQGPAGKFKIGRKVVYPVSEVVKWLEGRVAV